MIMRQSWKPELFWLASAAAVLVLLPLVALPRTVQAADRVVVVNSLQFVDKGLVAVGRIPANQRDKFGETFGSGSGMSVERLTWRRTAVGYQGNFVLLPDRGYNVEGTTNYRARLNKLTIQLTPEFGTLPLPTDRQQTGVKATLVDTILLTDNAGEYMTGLDPEAVRPAGGGLPALPLAKNGHVTLDPEAVVRLSDGGYFISDEYGPYIYRFSAEGRMVAAIRPPEAFIPMRKGTQNFSSNNPGPGAAKPDPLDPDTGRQNNQGFEGMSLTPDGSHLVVILQSATRQDGGDSSATRRYTRMLFYDLTTANQPRLDAEYVVPLPVFEAAGATLVAAQSEIVALGPTKFLLLARDSNNGYGLKGAKSVFRKIMILDTDGATNIAGGEFDALKPVAPKGVLDAAVKPATLTPFIDLNDNTQLNQFGLHSGEPNDRNNLSEKWEAVSRVSVLDPAAPNDYFMFVVNDNDFITQDGFQVGAPYKDAGGADVDTTLLVYRLTLPQGLKPY
jgi:hypothetical protein